MLRSAVAQDVVQRPLSEFMSKEVFGPIAERLGHGNHRLRGQLAVSLLLGMALSRYILRLARARVGAELATDRRARPGDAEHPGGGLVESVIRSLGRLVADSGGR